MNAKVHTLKTDHIEFSHIDAGIKLNEVRLDDREFAVGDYLFLRETQYTGEQMLATPMRFPLIYTCNTIMAVITHIHTKHGMKPNWKVLSIKVLRNTGKNYGRSRD